MLASITPLGERGRRSTWSLTVAAFLIGATAAGALAGAAAGELGDLVMGGLDESMRLLVLAAGLLAGGLLDVLPGRIPGPRRQVNERWLDEFRGWVYGLGFGAQLGLGVSTVVTSAATYAGFLAALLCGSTVSGAIILGCFGLVRGATPLVAAGVRRPDQLLAMHRRLAWLRRPVLSVVPLLLGGLLAVCAGAAL